MADGNVPPAAEYQPPVKSDDVEMGDGSPPPYQPSYGAADNVPPSYAQAQSDAPPSYDSIYGKVKAAKAESSGVADFFKKFLIIVVGTVGCTIGLGLILAIPISMVVMGSIHIHDCPAERYIPIYLVVGGVFGILKNLSNLCQRGKNHKDGREDENAKTNPFDGILSCFLTAWFIAGNVWIYRTLHNFQSDDKLILNPPYCDASLYWFAFWITTATYIIMGAVCFCICCTGCIAALVGGDGSG